MPAAATFAPGTRRRRGLGRRRGGDRLGVAWRRCSPARTRRAGRHAARRGGGRLPRRGRRAAGPSASAPGCPGDRAGARRRGRLAAVAAWDVAAVRGAVARLADVAGRLLRWRARLEGVGRSLESGGLLVRARRHGSAAAVGRGAVDGRRGRWTPRWTARWTACRRMAAAAAAAQEWAGARPGPRRPGADAPDRPRTRRTAPPRRRSQHAGAAAPRRGPRGGRGAPCSLAGRATVDSCWACSHGIGAGARRRGAAPRRAPAAVAAWWAGLPLAGQEADHRSAPAVVGALDGVPAWARDRANRLLLRRALADPDAADRRGGAAAAGRRRPHRARRRQPGGQVQLHLLDLAGDRVALALGDLDTADRRGPARARHLQHPGRRPGRR